MLLRKGGRGVGGRGVGGTGGADGTLRLLIDAVFSVYLHKSRLSTVFVQFIDLLETLSEVLFVEVVHF